MFSFANAAGTEAESHAGLPQFYRKGQIGVTRRLVGLRVVNSPNYPDPPYDYEAIWEDDTAPEKIKPRSAWTPAHEFVAQFMMCGIDGLSPCEIAYRIIEGLAAQGIEARKGGDAPRVMCAGTRQYCSLCGAAPSSDESPVRRMRPNKRGSLK